MARNIDTDLLRAFIAVVETSGFTHAAERLNHTQSAISMQIKRLEGVVRAELFLRLNKGIQLTPAGEELLDYARKIVALNDDAIESMLDRREDGVVRIGMMEDYATLIMPSLLKAFLARNPNVCVEVTTGLSSRMLSQLGRQYDLVLAMQGEHTRSGEFVRREQLVWAASPTMVIGDDTLSIALYPRDCLLRDLMIESLSVSGKRWRVAYRSASISAVHAVVQEGIAVSAFKQSTVSAKLRILDSNSGFRDMPRVNIVLYRAPNAMRFSATHTLAEFILQQLGENPATAASRAVSY